MSAIEINPKARTYIIGDVHGCCDELEVLLDHLINKENLSSDDYIIFVGDYIDRGKNSKKVIDHLIELKKHPVNSIFLKGNHEDMLMSFLGFDGNLGNFFLQNGGVKTLEDYGFTNNFQVADILLNFPKDHLDFLKSLSNYISAPKFYIVHAGFNPESSLALQTEYDLFWIREEFILNKHDFGKVVFFGHTPHKEVFYDLPYKVCVDTGLVYGHKLSCIEVTENVCFEISYNTENIIKKDLKDSNISFNF